MRVNEIFVPSINWFFINLFCFCIIEAKIRFDKLTLYSMQYWNFQIWVWCKVIIVWQSYHLNDKLESLLSPKFNYTINITDKAYPNSLKGKFKVSWAFLFILIKWILLFYYSFGFNDCLILIFNPLLIVILWTEHC